MCMRGPTPGHLWWSGRRPFASSTIVISAGAGSMAVVRATRRVHFSAAHRLFRADWSDERNGEVFGDCANPNWHGHNYDLDITVEGPVDPETGFLMDLKNLKELVERR